MRAAYGWAPDQAWLDTVIDTVDLRPRLAHRPHELSGGQQQRVGIVRALALRPDILLFDEPTSALDPELVGEVLAVVESLAADGMTLIMVTHEMRFARRVSNKVVFMHQGRVWESGTPEQIFERPETIELRKFIQ